jgi:hypothetical protein
VDALRIRPYVMEQPWEDVKDRASQRARDALLRARELSVLLAQMREGEHRDQAVYDAAQGSARLALQRAEAAVAFAARAHRSAAEMHRRAAEACERHGRADRAEEHRRLAVLDDAEGDADDAAAAGALNRQVG